MNIIIPMAGMGKRMRPHTLTVPKPLIRLAGKTIVQRLVEDIIQVMGQKVDEIGFVIGDFGTEVEENLLQIAAEVGASGRIFHQDKPLGTAHAIACAAPLLTGPVTIAFADTLFRAELIQAGEHDGTIWISEVEDPSAFGVVITDEYGTITSFAEKPRTFISNKAIIGIYSFREGSNLHQAIYHLLQHDLKKGGEYQLTDALQHMLDQGMKLQAVRVEEWLDCGNKDATVHTHQRILENTRQSDLISPEAQITDALIRPPCYIGLGVVISNSIIGPHVSVEQNTRIDHSIITNSVIQRDTVISNANIDHSMIGSFVEFKGNVHDVSIGDYTSLS
ncbi:MAG: NTP transferase domain-containing protein [Lentimicrobiaceae bacterium]|nr:NTP transferase domain-containing protein [Lentimicrobiaceae bacterium]